MEQVNRDISPLPRTHLPNEMSHLLDSEPTKSIISNSPLQYFVIVTNIGGFIKTMPQGICSQVPTFFSIIHLVPGYVIIEYHIFQYHLYINFLLSSDSLLQNSPAPQSHISNFLSDVFCMVSPSRTEIQPGQHQTPRLSTQFC